MAKKVVVVITRELMSEEAFHPNLSISKFLTSLIPF
jgi:hypothetical protein